MLYPSPCAFAHASTASVPTASRGERPGTVMTHLFVAVPSYKGITDDEARERCAASVVTQAGHSVSVGVLKHLALIDLARSELALAALFSESPFTLLLDDDCSIEGASLCKMLAAAEACDDLTIVSAPCRMRSEGNFFNVTPFTEPYMRGGIRVAESLWTGLGCVLVRRRVFEVLYERYHLLSYRSVTMPGMRAVGLFNSLVYPSEKLDPDAPKGENEFLGDDRAFSIRAGAAGFKIYAAFDTVTDHRGLRGAFGEEYDKKKAADQEAAERDPTVHAGEDDVT
jgi:hypothetical protein